MNSVISSLVLVAVAASSNGAAATDSSHPDPSVREIFNFVSTVLGHERLGAGDWRSALACTADLDGDAPGLVDETACPTTKTGGGGDCVWCDSSEMIGTGVCVGPDLKDEAGAIWDAVCGASANDDTRDDADPAAVRDGNSLSEMIRCSLDESMSVVADEVACVARKDAAGESCAWCDVSFLGSGACTTSSAKKTIGFLCSVAAEKGVSHTKEGSYLRGVHDEIVLGDHL